MSEIGRRLAVIAMRIVGLLSSDGLLGKYHSGNSKFRIALVVRFHVWPCSFTARGVADENPEPSLTKIIF